MKTKIKKQETSPMHVWSRFITVDYGSNRYDSHVVLSIQTDMQTYECSCPHQTMLRIYQNRLKMCTMLSFLYIHNASLEQYVRFQHKSLNICDLIEKYT